VIRTRFLEGVSLLYPDLNEADIVGAHINRAVRVQPLQVLGFSAIVPQVATRHEDFFVLNSSQFVNATLNNNEVIRAVDEFVAAHGARLAEVRHADPAPSQRPDPGPVEAAAATGGSDVSPLRLYAAENRN
jgi:hypothetical protein